MTDAEIQVEDVLHEEPQGMFGYFKVKGTAGDRLQMVGWAFADHAAVSAVEVVAEGKTIARTVPATPRPDVAETFPQSPSSLTSGFELEIEASGSGRSELGVEAVFAGGDRHSLGSLTVDVSRARGSRLPWRANRA
ncbi:MAG TPA: hypothetical protein VKB23_07385 [Solirubrobacterales bacterium]|nr:hypothetical protein [Solirubrobacterales bacterium]